MSEMLPAEDRRLAPRDWMLALTIPAVLRLVAAFCLHGGLFFPKYILLAQQWLNGAMTQPFDSSPAYTLWLALLIRLVGVQPELFRLLQIGFGLGSVALVAWIGARMFGRRAGVAAALLYGCCGPVLVYDGDLVTAGSVTLINLLALAVLLLAVEKRCAWCWLGAGLLVGIGNGIRPNLSLFVLLLIPWSMLAVPVQTLLGRLRAPALLLAGVLLAVAPVTWINWRASGEFVPVTWSGGSVLYASGSYGSTGLGFSPPRGVERVQNQLLARGYVGVPPEHSLYKFFADRAAGRRLGYREASALYTAEAKKLVRMFPAEFARLVLARAHYMLSNYEHLDTASLAAVHRALDRCLPFLYGAWLPLVLGGGGLLLLPLRDWRRWAPVLFLLVPYVATALLFYVNGRFRVPLLPVLALPGGLLIVHLIDRLRSRAPRRLAPLIVATLLLVPAFAQDDVLRWHVQCGRPGFLLSSEGKMLLRSGRPDQAIPLLEQAAARTPLDDPSVHAALAVAYRAVGDAAAAELADRHAHNRWTLEELQALDCLYGPSAVQGRLARAVTLWREGRQDEAVLSFEATAEAFPRHPAPPQNLALIEAQAEEPDWQRVLERITLALDLGLKFDLESVEAHRLRARALRELGRLDEAAQAETQAAWEENLVYEPPRMTR